MVYETISEGVYRFPVTMANVVNQNGRLFTKEALEKAIAKYMQLPDRFGEIITPAMSSPLDMPMQINVEFVSHHIDNIFMEDNVVYADLRVLGTEHGKKLKEMLENGEEIYVCARGTGYVSDQNIVDPYDLVAIDMGYTWAYEEAYGRYQETKNT